MSKFWRALMISAVATGVAAVVVKAFKEEAPAPLPAPVPDDPRIVDADRLTEEERSLLMQELEEQI
ncbi:MAG: hypothetical protein ACE5G0_16915 [Rhodothermales bacterium]